MRESSSGKRSARDQMMFLKASLVLVMLVPAITLADCPDFEFRCPSGEFFTINTCWRWSVFQCQTCRSTVADMRSRCQRFSCEGSVNNWYARHDGCSAIGAFSSGVMTDMFRGACAIHDLCYVTPGRTKSQCDDDFLYNMRETCGFPGVLNIGLAVCYQITQAAYEVVLSNEHTFPDFVRTCYRV